MTRVDFYLLEDVDLYARQRFACRLAYRAVCGGQEVYIHNAQKDDCLALDELMWAYPEHQFLPHALIEDNKQENAPVKIGWQEPLSDQDQVLINLSREVPKFFGRFERVAEIIVRDIRDEGRDRYKYYRDCGYPLHHHELNDWEQ